MNSQVNLALAQLDLAVGDVAGNTAKIIRYANDAREKLQADIVVFPELSVCGYPPEDLLFHSGLRREIEKAIDEIRESVRGIAILIGFPEYEGDRIYNACAVFSNGKLLAHYRKKLLPNYSVFDEERYFEAGKDAAIFKLNGIRIGLNICEDVWSPAPMAASRRAGAECIIAINGSPYEIRSQRNREKEIRTRIAEIDIPVVYVNMVGGQDELVFDGGSFVMDANGELAFRAPAMEEGLFPAVLHAKASGIEP
ncbi:MAG: nitrilase-related carbon-nitrogen hydrolase, partial [Woeseiaceae bacterium]|nr:nitrilase-related carbon-nitrogen hydrolase [Woeseiaceae bacterium]